MAEVGVDDQSQLTRAGNAFLFVQDLLFAGARFVSVGEGIDTVADRWEMTGLVMQMHTGRRCATYSTASAAGRCWMLAALATSLTVLSHVTWIRTGRLSSVAAAEAEGGEQDPRERGEVGAAGVFLFVGGMRIGRITRELTRLKVPKDHRASKSGLHPQRVQRIVANAKYVERLARGLTTTVRDSAGREKQVLVADGQTVVRDRPDLWGVAREVWEQAAARLAELKLTFGLKGGQKPRGPKPNPASVYPRSPLGGLLTRGACGGRMHQAQSHARRYF